jgi:hypothetical protein
MARAKRGVGRRKTRSGKDSHPSGNYVRKPAAHIVRPKAEPETDEPEMSRVAPGVTLPKLRFQQRKQIAGEWI